MRSLVRNRNTVCIGVAAALLAGCGGSQTMNVPTVGGSEKLQHHQQTFTYTGGHQQFEVPAGITSLTVIARGAAGGGEKGYLRGGRGGRVFAEIPVLPGERLFIFVGGTAKGVNGGYNGGGAGNYSGDAQSYGGGGATDIRERGDTLSSRIVVAAGGGGVGEYEGAGGAGGGLTGGAGEDGPGGSSGSIGYGGGGGNQKHGGRGGSGHNPGVSGSLGKGGPGGASSHNGGGGGGGGGYYGGGGGGGSDQYEGGGSGGGGGGGSSYAEKTAARVKMWRGWNAATGDGFVVINWQ